jgi:putative restriction endonuclease
MSKGVFISKLDPDYDDLPEVRYHFPKRYLRKAEECVGDWILYYEPRRNRGRQAYFATARVRRIERDPRRSDHFYALVEDYLEFPSPVPFKKGDDFYESALGNPDGSVNLGLFQWAIHHLPEHEYELIVATGMSNEYDFEILPEERVGDEILSERRLVEQLTLRPYRDHAFSKLIRAAYDSTCSMSGLRLLNGAGRPEVEAAHIRSVEARGPDSTRNGIALSRTVHWLFDRGVVSLEDDGRILKAGSLVPASVERLLQKDGYALLPQNPSVRPHREFLRWHRENVFKG